MNNTITAGSRVHYRRARHAPLNYPSHSVGTVTRAPDSQGMTILATEGAEPNLIVHTSELTLDIHFS